MGVFDLRLFVVAAALTVVASVATAAPVKLTDDRLDQVVAGSDHLANAVAHGGLTLQSQPFLNGITNPGRSAFAVPGEGDPKSGRQRGTPASSKH